MPLKSNLMAAVIDDGVALSTVDVYELASAIGEQFERLIDGYGPESVTTLMPMVIRVLEHLEELAKSSQDERDEALELKFTVDRLLTEKKQKAEERLKYEKELEQIEESWKNDIRVQRDTINRLEEENHRLSLLLRDKMIDVSSQADEENHIQELNAKIHSLQDTVHKQRETIRSLEKELSQKNNDIETMQVQVDHLTKLNEDHRHRLSIAQHQAQQLIEDKADLQGLIHDKDAEMLRLRYHLKRQSSEIAAANSAAASGGTNSSSDVLTDSGSARYTASELADVFDERDKLQKQLESVTDELQSYSPGSAQVEQGVNVVNEEELDPPVQGPINREPEEKLHPEKYERETGIRRLFKFLLPKSQKSGKKGLARTSNRGSLSMDPIPSWKH